MLAASFDRTVDILKAIGEPTRLRLVLLLASQDLTVSDLMTILGQSQPRISRHLKLLTESGVVSRHQEGAWAYFRLGEDVLVRSLVAALTKGIDDSERFLSRDMERLGNVRRERAERAASYFSRNADRWDLIRALHVPETEVEAALLEALGDGPVTSFLDVGTGTGRLLELLAPRAERAVGIDASREMLAIARAKLDAAEIGNAVVRQGDAYRLPVHPGSFDLVTIHQVLHFLDDPSAAIREAALALKPGGRLAIIDFAPHALEFLRDEHAHLRLGFGDATIAAYLQSAGMSVVQTIRLGPAGEGDDRLTVIIWIARHMRLPAEVLPTSDPQTTVTA